MTINKAVFLIGMLASCTALVHSKPKHGSRKPVQDSSEAYASAVKNRAIEWLTRVRRLNRVDADRVVTEFTKNSGNPQNFNGICMLEGYELTGVIQRYAPRKPASE